MQASRQERREAYLAKARFELSALAAQGLRMAGNAFSQVLFLKGAPSAEELAGAVPLSGKDGDALRASLTALGYAPEDWCALLTVDADGQALDEPTLRTAIATLDPSTLVACDEPAAQALREAYAEHLALLSDFESAMLTPGTMSRVLGMRVLNLGGFADALSDAHQKQVMWARLKQIPPLGAPY